MKPNKTKLAFILLIISFFLPGIICFFFYSYGKEVLIGETLKNLKASSNVHRKIIETFVDENLEKLALVSSRTKLRLSLKEFLDTRKTTPLLFMKRILLDAKSSLKNFQSISILSLDGRIVVSTNAITNIEYAKHKLFIQGKKANGIYFVAGEIDKGKEEKLCLSGPLYLKEKLLGVILVELDPKLLAHASKDKSLAASQEILLLDQNKEENCIYIMPFKLTSKKDSFPNQWNDFVKSIFKKDKFTEISDYRGKRVLIATSYIHKPNWAMIIKVDKEEAFASISTMLRFVLLLVFIFSTLAFIVSFFLAQCFNKLRREIAERKRAENKLQEYAQELKCSNEELDRFAHIVAHDLKEPLRGIYCLSQFLLEDYKDKLDKSGIEMLEQQFHVAKRMQELIDNLLHLAQLGKGNLEIKPTNLNEVIKDIKNTLEMSLREKNVIIHIPNPLPTVYCNETLITEAYRNLIVNAFKYNSNKDKHIEIGFENSESENIFYVKDNGIGIKKQYYQSIFHMFKRLNSKEFGEGTGAGLAFVKKIIEQHNGRIWCESTYGRETIFRFTLPTQFEKQVL